MYNALERPTILCEDGRIRAEDLSFALPLRPAILDTTDLHVVERQTIERAMRDVNGNKSRAARRLGISRTQLYIRLRKHGLERVNPWPERGNESLEEPPTRKQSSVTSPVAKRAANSQEH